MSPNTHEPVITEAQATEPRTITEAALLGTAIPRYERADLERMRTEAAAGDGRPYNNDILIRGAEAARAKPINLVKSHANQPLQPVGPWADELAETREEAREAGFAQGREEGQALGLKEAQSQAEREMNRIQAESDAELDNLRGAIEAMTSALEEHMAALVEGTPVNTVNLALEIAEAVLGHEVAATDDPGAEAIARCLDLAPATGDFNAHLHPDDLAVLGDVPGLEGRSLTLTPDSSLQRGDAIVKIGEATIDARLSESLRRVGEALR